MIWAADCQSVWAEAAQQRAKRVAAADWQKQERPPEFVIAPGSPRCF